MKLGVDLAGTRIVTAVADRGNYPLISFEGGHAEERNWFPPFIAIQGDKRLYGWNAWTARFDPSATVIAPFETLLLFANDAIADNLSSGISNIGSLTEVASAFRAALETASNLHGVTTEPFEMVLGMPVQANYAQQLLTAEAFRRAGFILTGLVAQPVADALEYRHTYQHSGRILVYHLAARAFTASMVNLQERRPKIVASEALDLGDDFDAILAELAWQAAGLPGSALQRLTPSESFSLRQECRRQREALAPSAQRLVVDLGVIVEGCEAVCVPLAALCDRCRERLDKTLEVVKRLLASYEGAMVAIYATGEGSDLPFVSRSLREAFGNQVCRAANGRATTAVGLAIASADPNPDELCDQSYLPAKPSSSGALSLPAVDPEHWLYHFIRDAMQLYVSDATVTFEEISDLLQRHKLAFGKDLETVRRMCRTYPRLFSGN